MLFSGMLIVTQHTWIHFLPTHRKTDIRSAGKDRSRWSCFTVPLHLDKEKRPARHLFYFWVVEFFFFFLHHWCYDCICNTLNSGSEHTFILSCFAFSHEQRRESPFFSWVIFREGFLLSCALMISFPVISKCGRIKKESCMHWITVHYAFSD